MKASLGVFLATVIIALVNLGCDKDTEEKPIAEQLQEQLSARQNRIRDIKAEIRSIAAEGSARFDFDDGSGEQRSRLEPLANELETLNENTGVEAIAPKLTGSWRQIWSDLQIGSSGEGVLADHLYQIVMPSGSLWNIALTEYGPLRRTELLKADYGVASETYDFIYTKGVYLNQWISVGADLQTLALQAETGKFDVNLLIFEEGQNPIGRKVTLEHIYIDDDFRISRGGRVEAGMNYLFFFERSPGVVASGL